MLFRRITFITFVLLVTFSTLAIGQIKKTPDDKLYENLIRVKGKVKFNDDLEYGNPLLIIFQKVGCRKCSIGILTNEKGEYEISLYRAKYRIIAREGRGGFEPFQDLLAADQPRIIDLRNVNGSVTFDIKTAFP